jgi:UDP-glucose 4-epimerase
VADSTVSDPAEFARELAGLEAGLARAERIGSRSSSSERPVYGRFGRVPAKETTRPRPATEYGRHKLAYEALVRWGSTLADPPSAERRRPGAIGTS